MIRAAAPLALALLACAPRPPSRGPLDPDPPDPLACPTRDACPSLQEELQRRCDGRHRVRRRACGALQELIVETDPESVTYTRQRLHFDGAGRLVARDTFVNEYGRRVLEGMPPDCPRAEPTEVCSPR